MTYIEPHRLKQIIALTAIVLLGGFLLFSLSGFISAFLGAIIFYIICAPLIRYFNEKTYSNIIGAPLLAVIQGGVSALGFWFFGIQDPVFWGVICGLFSFVPFGGTSIIWGAAGIVQISSNATWQGIGILIYGLVIISGMDYAFRFVIQRKLAKVHPLITFFGIILGVRCFGLPGFIFGPLLISYFLIMIKIYKNEYIQKKIIVVPESTDAKKPIVNKTA